MLADLAVPANSNHRIAIHAIVYDSFARNVERNSSAASLQDFLQAVFTPVGSAFHSTFDVGLGVHVVRQSVVRRIAKDPPVGRKDKAHMTRVYDRALPEQKLRLAAVMYDYTLEDTIEERDRPDIILSMVGEKKVYPSSIDFLTWPMYLGQSPHGHYSAGRYCLVSINTARGLSYIIQHELSHSLGCEHSNEGIMRPSHVHGSSTGPWAPEDKNAIAVTLATWGIADRVP